jgi:hypothetical protein
MQHTVESCLNLLIVLSVSLFVVALVLIDNKQIADGALFAICLIGLRIRLFSYLQLKNNVSRAPGAAEINERVVPGAPAVTAQTTCGKSNTPAGPAPAPSPLSQGRSNCECCEVCDPSAEE